MRVIASGNLTVELIRAQRFEVAYQLDTLRDQPEQCDKRAVTGREEQQRHIDRVELSPHALECDPWTMPTDRAATLTAIEFGTASETSHEEKPIEPNRITPVVGSPALAGLGVALVVPGTLLDVVA